MHQKILLLLDFNNNLIIQYGKHYKNQETIDTVQLPTSYTNKYVCVAVGGISGCNNANSNNDRIAQPHNLQLTSFEYGFQNSNGKNWCQYITIGY